MDLVFQVLARKLTWTPSFRVYDYSGFYEACLSTLWDITVFPSHFLSVSCLPNFRTYFVFASGEKEYYERQLATLKSFEEVDSIDASHVIDEDQDREEQMQHERAMNISNVSNVLLLVFKVIYVWSVFLY